MSIFKAPQVDAGQLDLWGFEYLCVCTHLNCWGVHSDTIKFWSFGGSSGLQEDFQTSN